jgi:hypothetical protein
MPRLRQQPERIASAWVTNGAPDHREGNARFFNRSSTIIWHHIAMPDDHPLTLRQANQARTDFAAIESNLEFIISQLARVPTRKQLARYSLLVVLGMACLT